ncbi:AMP-binding protein, partial [Kribbella sp.]|uniref:AMP-binding protein n=1 Tax=Kribbella sp. TaxID=1871183 RepID=UPI002D4E303E
MREQLALLTEPSTDENRPELNPTATTAGADEATTVESAEGTRGATAGRAGEESAEGRRDATVGDAGEESAVRAGGATSEGPGELTGGGADALTGGGTHEGTSRGADALTGKDAGEVTASGADALTVGEGSGVGVGRESAGSGGGATAEGVREVAAGGAGDRSAEDVGQVVSGGASGGGGVHLRSVEGGARKQSVEGDARKQFVEEGARKQFVEGGGRKQTVEGGARKQSVEGGAGELVRGARQAGAVVVVREVGERRRRDLSYWDQVLAGAQPLVLPGDRVRAAGDDAVGSVRRELEGELGAAVFAYSRERKLSPAMTMLAAVATVLGRFAAQDDVTIGSALVRPDDAPAIRPLPLRIDLSGEPDLGELTERIRDITAAAFEHSGTDLAILERDPLFQILVDFEDGDDELPPAIDIRFRLTHDGDDIVCTADYRAGLFEQRSVERLLDYLAEVLRRATTRPELRLPELLLPLESDLEALRELESDTDPVGPIGRIRRDAVVAGELSGLHTLFEQQVARTPDAIAVIQGDRELTYAELDRRANAVAWQLTDLGVKPGELVAVRVARGTEMIVAVLAVLKSGAAYLPLDPGVPESRWAFMVHDAAAVALVGDDAALADRLGLRLVPVSAVDGDARAKQAPPVRAAADDIAYCIYTSGSSGNPKGVVVPHRGPVNLVRHYLRTRRSLRTLQWTSFGFDVHVQEMFTTLASGAALVLIGEDDRYDPDAVVA